MREDLIQEVERVAQLFDKLRPAILPVIFASAGANIAGKTGQRPVDGAVTGLVLAELLKTDWARSVAGGTALAVAVGATGLLNFLQLPELQLSNITPSNMPVWSPAPPVFP